MQRKKYINIVEAFGFSFGLLGIYSLQEHLHGHSQKTNNKKISIIPEQPIRIRRESLRKSNPHQSQSIPSKSYLEHFIYGGLIISFNQYLYKKASLQKITSQYQLHIKYLGSSLFYFMPYYVIFDCLKEHSFSDITSHLSTDCPWLITTRLFISSLCMKTHSSILKAIQRQRTNKDYYSISKTHSLQLNSIKITHWCVCYYLLVFQYSH